MGQANENSLFRKELGRKGEEVAGEFLERKGFSILARNYLKKWGEIDIVAKKGGTMRFVEVKTVSRDLAGVSRENVSHVTGESRGYRAEENVHPWKIKRLHRAIESYMLENKLDLEWQIDVVAVDLDLASKKARVRLIENVVL